MHPSFDEIHSKSANSNEMDFDSEIHRFIFESVVSELKSEDSDLNAQISESKSANFIRICGFQ